MTAWTATLAKLLGAGVVTAIPAGLVLGSFTTGDMRRDYLFGYDMPSEGVEAATDPVPYTVPQRAKAEQVAAVYPAPPPSQVGDGFDDEAYLAGYDTDQDRAVSQNRDYTDGYDQRAADSDGYPYDDGSYGEDRGWQRELTDADLDSRDDPFVSETRRARHPRRDRSHGARGYDEMRGPDDALAPHYAVTYGPGRGDRIAANADDGQGSYSVRTPAGTVTVTRAADSVEVRTASGVSRRDRAPSQDAYLAPAD